MVESAPLWAALLVPPALAALALVAAAGDAALGARATGRPLTGALAIPLRETARLLVQQRRAVVAADRLLGAAGPALVFVAALLAALVVPVGGRAVLDLSYGIVWFNAAEVLVWAGLWLTGWGSNSPYGLAGGYRYIALGLAYELPHMFALITAALGAESLRVADVAAAQSGLWFVAWMPVAFAAFLLSALAISFVGPFGQAVGRDLAGGVLVEVSGPDRLLLLAGRYLLLAVTAAVGAVLFLGGDSGPFLPGFAWLLLKTVVLLALLVGARRLLPVLPLQRLEEVAWVLVIPLTILQALLVAIVVLAR